MASFNASAIDYLPVVKDRVLVGLRAKYSFQHPLYDFDIFRDGGTIMSESEHIVGVVTRMVYAEELGRREVTAEVSCYHPETWWDHAKIGMPSWISWLFAAPRFKTDIVRKTEVFDVKMAFPDYVPPNGLEPYIIIRSEKETVYG